MQNKYLDNNMLFVNLGSDGIVDATKKAKVVVAAWFIGYGFYTAGIISVPSGPKKSAKKKKA